VTVRRVAVVGFTGFVGRHVRHALTDSGHEALLLSRSPQGEDDGSSRRLPAGPAALHRLLREKSVQVVVNCAGLTHGSTAALQAANVAVVTTLIEALGRTSIRLVQIGSAAEYGPGRKGRPVREDHDGIPPSEYGISKLAATRLVVAAAERGDLSGVVLRLFNPIGAGISPESLPGRAASQIREALAGGAVHLGPLGVTRDFVDVRDVAEAVVAACDVETMARRVLNIGSGRGTTARELVRALASVAGFTGPILEDAGSSPRSEAIDWQVADIGAASAALGWAPRRSVRDAVTALWEAG
jgi:nucleoside-diphosphate-sugar epimerase